MRYLFQTSSAQQSEKRIKNSAHKRQHEFSKAIAPDSVSNADGKLQWYTDEKIVYTKFKY